MNTDLHGWEAGRQARQESGAAAPHMGSPSSLSDPCSIRVSSVAQQSSTGHTTTSVTMIVPAHCARSWNKAVARSVAARTSASTSCSSSASCCADQRELPAIASRLNAISSSRRRRCSALKKRSGLMFRTITRVSASSWGAARPARRGPRQPCVPWPGSARTRRGKASIPDRPIRDKRQLWSWRWALLTDLPGYHARAIAYNANTWSAFVRETQRGRHWKGKGGPVSPRRPLAGPRPDRRLSAWLVSWLADQVPGLFPLCFFALGLASSQDIDHRYQGLDDARQFASSQLHRLACRDHVARRVDIASRLREDLDGPALQVDDPEQRNAGLGVPRKLDSPIEAVG